MQHCVCINELEREKEELGGENNEGRKQQAGRLYSDLSEVQTRQQEVAKALGQYVGVVLLLALLFFVLLAF